MHIRGCTPWLFAHAPRSKCQEGGLCIEPQVQSVCRGGEKMRVCINLEQGSAAQMAVQDYTAAINDNCILAYRAF